MYKGVFKAVYEIVKQIPKGRVATYGDIANLMGNKHFTQRVGYALYAIKDIEAVPTHRVVNRYGELSKSFRFGGVDGQRELLEKEGIVFEEKAKVDLEKYRWK